MADVTIYYCTAWGYKPRAARLAARIKEELGLDSELKVGASGQFDVLFRGELVASRKQASLFARVMSGGFPDEAKTVEALREKLG